MEPDELKTGALYSSQEPQKRFHNLRLHPDVDWAARDWSQCWTA